MLDLKGKSIATPYNNGQHKFLKLELKSEEFDSLVLGLADLLPSHYVDPNSFARTLEILGKPQAAQKLRIRIPETKKIRSGDVGEALTTAYIEEETDYIVPIRKLRWRDHRNMAMRSDDVIGILINPQNQSLNFLKAEAKSNQSLSRVILEEAREELDSEDGRPTPHGLLFIAERLREIGNQELAEQIEKTLLDTGIALNKVKHLLFVVTQSNPSTLQKEAFDNYDGTVQQQSVGLKVSRHQQLVSSVYQRILDDLDN